MDDEHRNKRKKPFDFTGWTDYILPVRPARPMALCNLIRFPLGYATTRKRLRLWCFHLPVPGGTLPWRRGLWIHPGQHALPQTQDGLGNRTRQIAGRPIAFLLSSIVVSLGSLRSIMYLIPAHRTVSSAIMAARFYLLADVRLAFRLSFAPCENHDGLGFIAETTTR